MVTISVIIGFLMIELLMIGIVMIRKWSIFDVGVVLEDAVSSVLGS